MNTNFNFELPLKLWLEDYLKNLQTVYPDFYFKKLPHLEHGVDFELSYKSKSIFLLLDIDEWEFNNTPKDTQDYLLSTLKVILKDLKSL